MSDDKRYNGWRNYETWNVALWLGNEEGTQRYWDERTREIARTAEPRYEWESVEDAARSELADELEREIEGARPELGASMFADLLGAALSEVDWREIAENWLGDLSTDDWGAMSCPTCDADGELSDGKPCPTCSGSGEVSRLFKVVA